MKNAFDFLDFLNEPVKIMYLAGKKVVALTGKLISADNHFLTVQHDQEITMLNYDIIIRISQPKNI